METAKKDYEKPEMLVILRGGGIIFTLSRDNDALDQDWDEDLI